MGLPDIRYFTPFDHSQVSTWWEAQGWPSVPLSSLPKTGFIIDGYCAGFMYKTDSDTALVEWIIANPNTDKEERSNALGLLFDSLIKETENEGYKNIFSWTNHPGLIKRYQDKGFEVADTNVNLLVRNLC